MTHTSTLTGCTIAVVVGVVLEEVEYFLSWPSVRRFVPLQILLPTHRFDLWVAKITKLGWALIVLGVAGEGLYEARVSHADGWLQDFGNIVVASVQREAADAVGEAGRAIERAGEANREAGEARKEAERLHRENLLLQADVLKLRERMADRHLTPKQQSAIANRLCPQFGGLNITIGLYSADGEMNALAADIDGALPLLCPNNRIGWAVSISPVQTTEGFSGLRIFVDQRASVRSHLFASALFEALKSEGLRVEGPMPRPNLGARLSGGGRTRTFDTGVPGTEAGTFVEIGIGRKP